MLVCEGRKEGGEEAFMDRSADLMMMMMMMMMRYLFIHSFSLFIMS